MMVNVRNYILLFVIYAFVGWIIEVINSYIRTGKFINRGFLIGPYLPIYGFGALGIVTFLHRYYDDLLVLFCMGTILCCVLEYFTSYIMEKLFHARWWDYSYKKFNLAGRICLETAVLFGLGGCIVVRLVNPCLVSLFEMLPSLFLNIIVIIFVIVFIIDFMVSFKIIFAFRNFTSNIKKDSTTEINNLVKKMISSKSFLGKRLMKAFPDFKLNLEKIKNIKLVQKRKK